MTNDKQIEAVAKELAKYYYLNDLPECGQMRKRYDCQTYADRYHDEFVGEAKAALAATHEQYKPLVEALQFLLEANKDWAETYELAWPNNAVYLATKALASLPEELRG